MSIYKKRMFEVQQIKKESSPMTVRLPNEIQSFIETMASDFEISKHEALLILIKDGKQVAEDAMNQATEDDKNSTFHILNTNKRHTDMDQKRMLSEHIALASYGTWKDNIKRLKKNDYVFLFENGVGIIAYGNVASDDFEVDDAHDGGKNECYSKKLINFEILKTPISAEQIRKILGRKVVFARTMSGVPDGQKLLNVMTKS